MKDYLGKFINSRLQIEALKNLAMMGNDTLLIGMRSRERLKLEESTNPYLIQIPIRFFPIVSDLIYLIVLAFLLPIHMPLLNRVSRVSYLFIAHPNKRCETHFINLGTRMRARVPKDVYSGKHAKNVTLKDMSILLLKMGRYA